MLELTQSFQHYVTAAPAVAYLIAFAVGFMTSLTPCVYPMIPITAAYIGGSSYKGAWGRSLLLSLCYVLGVSSMYSVLGAVAALTGIIFGTFASSPYINLILAIIFILLGLSMLDVFAIPTPKFMQGAAAQRKRGGFLGAYLIGLATGFIATPCTTPVVLAILTIVAKKQNVLYGTTLLFVFSLGMSVLLVAVGTFAGSMAVLPKSGEWMVKVKKFFGILMMVCAVYFIVQAVKMWL